MWLKLALLGGLLAALGGGLWYVHHRWWQQGYNAAAAQDRSALEKARAQARKVETRIVTRWKTQVRVVQRQGRVIVREVPVYVTRQDNSRCLINTGFVQLWNGANRGVLPPYSSVLAEAPSDVELSDVATEHAREAELCRLTENQLLALQRAVRAQPHGSPSAPH